VAANETSQVEALHNGIEGVKSKTIDVKSTTKSNKESDNLCNQ